MAAPRAPSKSAVGARAPRNDELGSQEGQPFVRPQDRMENFGVQPGGKNRKNPSTPVKKSAHRTTEPEVYGSEIAGPYALKGKQAQRSNADIAADAAAERTVESPSYRAEQNARALSNPNLRDGIYGPNDPTTATDNNISKDAQSRIGGKTGGLY